MGSSGVPEREWKYEDEKRIRARDRQRRNTLAMFDGIEQMLLNDIAAGIPLKQAVEWYGLTLRGVHNRARWDAEWSERLDASLLAGRDPDLEHGRDPTYKRFGCRCPDCRDAHRAGKGRDRGS
ncbi:hypothetical protein [Glycomyces xiaoerkulensis]|uniref:hypothetical protein n=1 Tax=Glycomyces xiaoerkulensis TaxID=2038139 RepID=UPI000C25C4BC|nr:hypothetical protein [Glycomyces xiaoerkulensis]